MRDAAHAVVLPDAAGAVGIDRHFGHVAIVVGIGNGRRIGGGFGCRRGTRIGRSSVASRPIFFAREVCSHGDRLAPQVIQAIHAAGVTLWYSTSFELASLPSLSRVTTATGEGSLPYIESPAAFAAGI